MFTCSTEENATGWNNHTIVNAYKLIRLIKVRHYKKYKVYLNDVCKVQSKELCDKQVGALYVLY